MKPSTEKGKFNFLKIRNYAVTRSSNATASKDSRFRVVARYADDIKNVWNPPFSSRSKRPQFPQIGNSRRFASTFIRAERRPGGRLKKWCYSAARKKREKEGKDGGETNETIFTRAVKAFSFNAIRTEHSWAHGLVCRLLSPSFPPSWDAWRSEKFIPPRSEKQKGKEGERLEWKSCLTCFLCAVHWPSELYPQAAFLLSAAETGRSSWLTNNKSRSSDAECAIDRRSLTRKSVTDSTSLIMRRVLRRIC